MKKQNSKTKTAITSNGVLAEVKTNIISAKRNRNSICLLGGTIYRMKLKIDRKEKITKGDLKELQKFLARIDKYDQSIWKQMLAKRFRYRRSTDY